MKLVVVRNDSQALVLEQRSPESVWLLCCVLSVLLAAIGALHYLMCIDGRPIDPRIFYTLLTIPGILAAGAIVVYANPYAESFSLDRDLRTIRICRRRLLAAARCDLKFEEVRDVALIADAYFILETRDLKIRFPVGEPLLTTGGLLNERSEIKSCVAAVRSELGVPAPVADVPADLTSCAMKVLRDHSEALVLRDEPRGGWIMAVMPLFGFVTLMVWNSALGFHPWHRNDVRMAAIGALAVAALFFWTYSRQFDFDRIGRRVLITRNTWLRTIHDDVAFKDVTGLGMSFRRGALGAARMILLDDRSIDVTPTPLAVVTDPGIHRQNCEVVLARIRELVGLDDHVGLAGHGYATSVADAGPSYSSA